MSRAFMQSVYKSGSITEDGVPYTLKISGKAKYPRLKMVPHEGLVVIIPDGYDRKRLPELLARYREWIRKTAERIEVHSLQQNPLREEQLPRDVMFHYHGEAWKVVYSQNGVGVAEAIERSGNLVEVTGDISNTGLCRAVLQLWLKNKAHADLVPKLWSLAGQHGFSIKKAGVRLQKSRWGSCSGMGTITLNSKLLFLPSHLVHSVMVHELCHTLHMDHSRLFWKKVEQYNAQYRSHDIELKTAWKYVPAWAAVTEP
jgi:predicted metal-dependent hydrolase